MPEECPYCSAEISTPEVAKTRSMKFSIPKIFSISRATTKTTSILGLDCVSCGRKFLVKFRDLKWFVNEIKYEQNAIRCFAVCGVDVKSLPSSITGIALRDKKMDICFKYLDQRAYVGCIREKDGWHAVSVELIRFG